ncbi:DNA-binding transcriptional regulator, MarR family [Streptomyces qinglanensis]|uniref:DNA-binding transcriptional regulator, MarR family n=2 Tax=Streptomyces qinglanensis TaxID=943816 RepID=A0A1H9VYD7_9ACTN|nr:DNA-binding transcriptional regulator, MarR family [Streptomyces qinglanensis]
MSEQLPAPRYADGPPPGAVDQLAGPDRPVSPDEGEQDLAELDKEAVNALRAAVMRLSRRLKHQRVDESLSPTEMSVLGTLARCGSATPSELARKEHVQPPSMTRIVAMLEAKGLVRLDAHPEDRRQKVVTQTEQAESMLAAARAKRNAWLTELVQELDEEDRATLRAAAPVLEKLAHL